tara:strand:+ start:476 stop:796 length:321 start_codon:yes stop_codon:yes gene_type:complete
MSDENQQPHKEQVDRQAQTVYVQQPRKSGLIEDFFAILKGSWILQIGVLLLFLSVSYNITAGGKLVMFGITILDSVVTEPCKQFNEHYDKDCNDSRYKNVDTLEAK